MSPNIELVTINRGGSPQFEVVKIVVPLIRFFANRTISGFEGFTFRPLLLA